MVAQTNSVKHVPVARHGTVSKKDGVSTKTPMNVWSFKSLKEDVLAIKIALNLLMSVQKFVVGHPQFTPHTDPQ